jgi:uncharacterized protein (TIRG00374 family)
MANRVVGTADRFHQILTHYLRHHGSALLAVLLCTGVLLGAKLLIAYLLVRGLGVAADVWEVFSIQIVVLLVVYFCPTPGGSGAAELGPAVLMAGILPAGLPAVYVVLWRTIVTYIPVVLGSVILLRYLGKRTIRLEDPSATTG